MSQHIIRTVGGSGIAVTVTLGYDRPLDFVFCTIMNAQNEPIYTNLDDDDAGTHQQDIDYYRPILARLGIEVPEAMFAEVEFDQANVVANRFVDHTVSR
ncbi:hypothetical protein ACPOL_6188 [Acidisarcina polymorpha]|uniref:Uncharacterized protein n=1 Tax=Acidisarcina polymorpha TaxID=2211140 RepID=A0A2Z5G822_9BACT|nr:hypothetical protein [Acidisarcina polymorpha]AXC15432.1 hypothetical protein ACPOL_6188 [Acidisarcina polymorpha]